MELKVVWGIDECLDPDKVFDELDNLQEQGKIFYEKSDGWTVSIKDVELCDSEIKNLIDFLEELDVYPSDVNNDIDDNWVDWD